MAWRTVSSYFGLEIFMDFDIGTPGQTMRILIDSGSDWFWISGKDCILCGGMKHFDQGASSSYELVSDDSIILYYGSGEVHGNHIRETVCVSLTSNCEGLFCTPVCVEEMNMMSVT